MQVKQTVVDALMHQDVPFEKLVEELNPPRDTSHHPLFQAMFTMQNQPGGGPVNLGFTNLELESLHIASSSSKFDISLIAWEQNNGIAILLNYNTSLFEKTFMDRFLEHFTNLLADSVSNKLTFYF